MKIEKFNIIKALAKLRGMQIVNDRSVLISECKDVFYKNEINFKSLEEFTNKTKEEYDKFVSYIMKARTIGAGRGFMYLQLEDDSKVAIKSIHLSQYAGVWLYNKIIKTYYPKKINKMGVYGDNELILPEWL